MFHRLSLVVAVLVTALLVVPAALAVKVHVRVEGKERTIFGATAPLIDVTSPRADALPENALDALESASVLGEFYYHVTPTSFGPYIDQVGRYPAVGQTGWVFKLNGVSPPVGANEARLKDGDTVLWYWAQFGVAGGPKTLVLQRRGRCYTVLQQDDAGATSRANGAELQIGSKRTVQTRNGRACIGPHKGLLVRGAARWRSPLECSCMRRFALVLAVAALAGCGGGEHGTATVWITRDQGAHVLLSRSVPAGLTAMQALDRVADIKTRYAGRFVQSIDGIDGSVTARRDWFYFVNGYEGDRSAAEYRLHDGDVEWWDFRSWAEQMHVPVVVGAFPEPFLHGFGGKTLPARVLYTEPAQRAVAERVAKLVRGRAIYARSLPRDVTANTLVLEGPSKQPSLTAVASQSSRPGSAVVFVYRGDPGLLLKAPPIGRYRYEVRP